MIHGKDVSVPSAGTGEDVIGFYTTRWLKAPNAEDAAKAAMVLVMADWTDGEYAELNRGDPPVLSVDETTKVGLFQFLRRQPGGGHTFYSSE